MIESNWNKYNKWLINNYTDGQNIKCENVENINKSLFEKFLMILSQTGQTRTSIKQTVQWIYESSEYKKEFLSCQKKKKENNIFVIFVFDFPQLNPNWSQTLNIKHQSQEFLYFSSPSFSKGLSSLSLIPVQTLLSHF